MELVDRAQIISDHWLLYESDPAWGEYFGYNDLAMPYAFGVAFGHILELSMEGVVIIDEAWNMLCDILNVDANAEWNNVDAMFASADFGVAQ